MTTMTAEWRIVPNGLYNSRGEQLCFVEEKMLGTNDEGRRFGPMPGAAAEAFIRARRAVVKRAMEKDGHKKINPH